MIDLDITKISSKGQVVIPQEMRKGLHEGEKLVIIKNGNQLILKSVKEFNSNVEEDLEFARRTEQAWKRYEQGKFKSMNFDVFIAEMERW